MIEETREIETLRHTLYYKATGKDFERLEYEELPTDLSDEEIKKIVNEFIEKKDKKTKGRVKHKVMKIIRTRIIESMSIELLDIGEL